MHLKECEYTEDLIREIPSDIDNSLVNIRKEHGKAGGTDVKKGRLDTN